MKDVIIFSDDTLISGLLSYAPSQRKVTVVTFANCFMPGALDRQNIATIIVDVRHKTHKLKEILDTVYINERQCRVILITNGTGEFAYSSPDSALSILFAGMLSAVTLEQAISNAENMSKTLSLGDMAKALMVEHFSNLDSSIPQRQEAQQHG